MDPERAPAAPRRGRGARGRGRGGLESSNPSAVLTAPGGQGGEAAGGRGRKVTGARRIGDDEELRAIAGGHGYVVDPFNRRWHHATCPRIASLTLGQPKWFAPDREALDAYQRARIATYPTAS